MAEILNIRADEDMLLALQALMSDGTPKSRANRHAIIEAGARDARQRLGCEVEALAAAPLRPPGNAQVLREMGALRAW